MSFDVFSTAPRTPSRFHDDARRRNSRDSGHDRVQQEFLAFLRYRSNCALPEGAAVHRHVEGEMPIERNGQVVSFVDCAEILHVNLTKIVSIFEIKPKIETVTGIVRQMKAMVALVQSVMKPDILACHAVVPHDDPGLQDLRKAWPHVWAWNIEFPKWEWDDASP